MTSRQANVLIGFLAAGILLLAVQNVVLWRELRHVHKSSEAAEELAGDALDRLSSLAGESAPIEQRPSARLEYARRGR